MYSRFKPKVCSRGVPSALMVNSLLLRLLSCVYSFVASMLVALSPIAIIAGIWAQKFDQLAIISNFVVQPLAFLSGTFYSIDKLPEYLKFLAYCNPFFYVVDGFRFGFLGVSDVKPYISLSILLVCNLILGYFTWYILKIGYRLKT